MMTRKSQSGEKKPASAGDPREWKPRIGSKEKCERISLQRVPGARNMDPIAVGDRRKVVREAVSQEVRRRTRIRWTRRKTNSQGRDPSTREEKTARDGIQEPVKKNSQGRDRRAVPTAGKDAVFIVREMGKGASENPRYARESNSSKLSR